MILIDAHCHLDQLDSATAAEVLGRARQAGLVHAVVVGQWQKPGDFGNALEIARAHPDFLAPTMGIHPHEAARAGEEDFQQLEKLCALSEIRAVGEAGLDYYYAHSPRLQQTVLFRRHCRLAKRLAKPLVVHVRDAHRECFEILQSEAIAAGVIHCFTGDTDDARRYLDLGLSLSISGIVTYKKTEGLQAAVRFAPVERLMVETDSPYLAPVPFRGRKNEPSLVIEVARRVAELKGLPLEELASIAARNANELFDLKLSLFLD